MKPIVVIGYGSTLRFDDGVGYLAAERLMDLLPEDQCNVIARQLLTPDLASALADCSKVIFIDAAADKPPGQIDRLPVTTKGSAWGAFVHEMAPGVLLDCVKEVYGKTPEAALYTIGGENFGIGEGLSPQVQKALDQIVELVRQEVTVVSGN